MARKATGQVVERTRKSGAVYGLRFRVDGERRYETLGSSIDGWTRERAEEELNNVLADVRRGIWRPRKPIAAAAEVEVRPMPTFHEFASEWMTGRRHEGLRARTLEVDEWALSLHLLPVFKDYRLDGLTAEDVDRYKRAKLREREQQLVKRPLSNRAINTTLATLAQVLELAVEYGHIETNPAKGRRRRVPTERTARTFLEPAQLALLLEAAGELDDGDRGRRRYRRPLVATLAFAGLRIGELLALRWRDVDLAKSQIRVELSKTEAGVRRVDIQPELYDELAELKMAIQPAPHELVFPTSTGQALQATNVRRRILAPATTRANELLEERGVDCEPLPNVTPHALRRTFASWLVAEGEDAAYVMNQLGHTDPKMTLGLYAKALRSKRRRPHARRSGRAGLDAMGTSAQSHDLEPLLAAEAMSDESRIPAGDSEKWS